MSERVMEGVRGREGIEINIHREREKDTQKGRCF